jgi:bifunctional non-homologous end joining protein LigD
MQVRGYVMSTVVLLCVQAPCVSGEVMTTKLKKYEAKRDFEKTPEPQPLVKKSSAVPIFVIQQHHASHMHYDFRLEMDGMLKSWAVPKGPSTNPKEKRLAALTEDHPLEYATFEGIIPEGYGAGSVIVWDTGTYENLTEKNGKKLSMAQAFKNKHIKIKLNGKKLQGAYAITWFKDNDWLLVKVNDEYADARSNPVSSKPESVLSKKTIEELDTKKGPANNGQKKNDKTVDGALKTVHHDIQLSHLDKLYFPESSITKGNVIDYYQKIASHFVPLSKNRPMVMHRFPDGIAKEGFYQKQIPDYFPAWIHHKQVTLKKGEEQELVMVDDADSLVYLANQGVLEFHAWLSSARAVNNPDKIVFDLDPSGADIQELRFAARTLKKILEGHKLVPFIMTTGSRGYHVVVPIIPEHSFEKVHEFAQSIAQSLVEQYPDRFTITMSKAQRKGNVFIDYLRNSFGQTSVAPYSLRARENAPIATPIGWLELSKTKPQQYTLKNIFKRLLRKKDPWKDFFKKAKRLSL